MKAKLLMTSTLLSQVLNPLAAQAAALEQGVKDSNLRQQLNDYFQKEKTKAEEKAVFVARNYYWDDYITPNLKQVEKRMFSLTVLMSKLKAPVTGGSNSESCNTSSSGGPRTFANFNGPATFSRGASSSSTGECTAPFSFNYQFFFKREDVSAQMTAIWGDNLGCNTTLVGRDVTGKEIFAEACNNNVNDLYYGNLIEDTTEKSVYEIVRFSENDSNGTAPGPAFARMEVWKLASGGSLMNLVPLDQVMPIGQGPASIQFDKEK